MIKSFESFGKNYSHIDLYDYFSDISDDVKKFDIYSVRRQSQSRSGIIMVEIIDNFDSTKKYKNSILINLMDSLAKNKSIARKLDINNSDNNSFNFSTKLMPNLKNSDLIKWIEESSKYCLSDAGIVIGKYGYKLSLQFIS
jgi:hypothetical protein